MNKILLGLILTVLAFNVNASNQDDIIESLQTALVESQLTCIDTVKNLTYSSYEIRLSLFLKENIKMNISENTHPNIEFDASAGSGLRVSLKANLNEDLTKLVYMSVKFVRTSQGERLNYGTILRPNYQRKETKKVVNNYICQ